MLYSSKLYIGIRTSKSSALSIFIPLFYEIQLINDALFLKTNFFSPKSLLFVLLVAVALAPVLLGASKSLAVNVFLVTVIFPLTTIYASLNSHKSDLSVEALVLIALLILLFLSDWLYQKICNFLKFHFYTKEIKFILKAI